MTTTCRVDLLEAAAESWAGTPFCAGAAVKGQGACCHRLVAEVYFAAGWLPRIDLPGGSPRWSQGSNRSLMEEWLDGHEGRKYFCTTAVGQAPIRAGDLLGFRVGRCVHHLAIALREGRLVHAVEGHGTAILSDLPAVWAKRLARVWVPLTMP
jgi:cell wall-associated NlpC family hydrolase